MNCSVWEKWMLQLNGTSCPCLIILKSSSPFWQCWKQRCSDSPNRKIAHNIIFMELDIFFSIYRNSLILQGLYIHIFFLKNFSNGFIQKVYFLSLIFVVLSIRFWKIIIIIYFYLSTEIQSRENSERSGLES